MADIDEDGTTGRRGPDRPPDDSRRRRGADRRHSGWGDGIDRFFCAHDHHQVPSAFPVETRIGVAIIPPTEVDRRPNAILLCTFEHAGDHAWPDGVVVESSQP